LSDDLTPGALDCDVDGGGGGGSLYFRTAGTKARATKSIVLFILVWRRR